MGSQAAMSKWADAPHIILVPRSTSGHIIPFLQFARRLASAGVVATLVTYDKHLLELQASLGTTDFSSQEEGYPLRIVGLRDQTSLAISHKEWQDRVREDPSEERRVIDLLESVIADLTSPSSYSLRGVHPATPPLCILHDMFECWSQEVADRLRIGKHLLYVSPAAALSCALQSQRLFQQGLVPITRESRERIFDDIPGLPPIPALDLASPFLNAAMYEWWMRHLHNRYRKADVILINTFYELEKPVLDALRNDVLGSSYVKAKSILDIGPLLPESYVDEVPEEEALPDPCISWLDTRGSKSVLYISFGSGATHSAPQLLELALGLEASGVSFLWVIRPPNAPGFSPASEAESVTEFLPLGFEERVRERGLCYSRWAPQTRILKHPAVGGFLSHCGWNSTLETIVAGVPVLAWPKFAEQHLIRRFLVDAVEVAIELMGRAYTQEELESETVMPVRFVTKEEIEKKARSLLHEAEGEIVRENVQKLSTKAREVGASGGSSRRSFEAYVRLLHDSRVASAPHQ